MTPSSTRASLPDISHGGKAESSSNGLLVDEDGADGALALAVPAANWLYSAHYGYIYCISLVRDYHDERTGGLRTAIESGSPERLRPRVQLVTGSGDEDVKVRHRSPLHILVVN